MLGTSARMSRLYQTPAFPPGAGPDFVNGAVAILTQRSAEEILGILHDIEAEAGRTRTLRWGQRVLDLDLIALGGSVRPDKATFDRWRALPLDRQMQEAPRTLILPHPRMQDRSFVLQPLMDVAPDWVHPVLELSVAQMLAARPAEERASVVPLEP